MGSASGSKTERRDMCVRVLLTVRAPDNLLRESVIYRNWQQPSDLRNTGESEGANPHFSLCI